MNVVAMVLEGLILIGFQLAKSGKLDDAKRKVLDGVLDGLDMARSGVKLLGIFDGDVSDEEKAESQRIFDAAQARFRARLAES